MCPEKVGVIPFVGYLLINALIAEVELAKGTLPVWRLTGT